jgi:hypothetical protein
MFKPSCNKPSQNSNYGMKALSKPTWKIQAAVEFRFLRSVIDMTGQDKMHITSLYGATAEHSVKRQHYVQNVS